MRASLRKEGGWELRGSGQNDSGRRGVTILANLLAMCAALQLPAKVVAGFVDAEVNRLLGLDTQREVAFSMVAVGRTRGEPPPPPAEMQPLSLETVPLSRKEVDYPAMREMLYAGPMFASPVPLQAGEVVNREGFAYADFIASTLAGYCRDFSGGIRARRPSRKRIRGRGRGWRLDFRCWRFGWAEPEGGGCPLDGSHPFQHPLTPVLKCDFSASRARLLFPLVSGSLLAGARRV